MEINEEMPPAAETLDQLDGAGRPIEDVQDYARDKVLSEFEDIVNELVKQGKKGSATHVKQLLQLSGIDRELKAAPLRGTAKERKRSVAELIEDGERQADALLEKRETPAGEEV